MTNICKYCNKEFDKGYSKNYCSKLCCDREYYYNKGGKEKKKVSHKLWSKKYNQKPEVKARKKEYNKLKRLERGKLYLSQLNAKRKQNAKAYNLTLEQYQEKTKECFICGFNLYVDLHHIDYNHSNNNLKNLIGLCPNHHKMIHSWVFKRQLEEQIKQKLTDKAKSIEVLSSINH